MRLFITGISGLLGINLALQARERFQVDGCYYAHPVVMDGMCPAKLDVSSFVALDRTLRTVRPDIIVHTAGLTNVDACEANPEQAYRLNVEATHHVAKIAYALGARLVHISTDHLFDGTKPWKAETDNPTPLNVYARTKLQAEHVVAEACPQALVVRTNFYGWGTPVRASFSDWILVALRRGEELRMFTDVFFTPILINDLGEIILELIAAGASGLYHIAGRERLSKYDFAMRVADVFDIPDPRIQPISVEEMSLRAVRPKDMSLGTDKVARFLGREMPMVSEGLARLRWLEETGWYGAVTAVLAAHV